MRRAGGAGIFSRVAKNLRQRGFLLALISGKWVVLTRVRYVEGGTFGKRAWKYEPQIAMKAAPASKTGPAPTTVVLVDDHDSLRGMLRLILNLEGGFEVVGEAGSGLEAMKVCRAARPQIVILDLKLPELNGTHLIRLLRQEPWEVRVLVYTGSADEALMLEALAESPHGFVRKEDSLPELRAALKAVVAGARLLSPWASRLMPSKADDALRKLTPSERAVLQMLAEGLHTKEVAEALGASVKTVEHHRQHLRDKLGLHDVAALTRFAIRHRMVAP